MGKQDNPIRRVMQLYSSFTQMLQDSGNQDPELSVSYGKPGVLLVTDGDRFRQILSNLLTNAIKYTEKGSGIGIRELLDKIGLYLGS
jgi:signal transduction histidine kinase